jgi:hypothetical protein
MNYLMHQNGDNWQLGDIYLAGTISQMGEFSLAISPQCSRAREPVAYSCPYHGRATDLRIADAAIANPR